jgi:hypothetical protein
LDPTIFISTPPAGGTVPQTFTAAGVVNPASSSVLVKLWNVNNTYGPFNAIVNAGGSWNYNFQNVAVGTGYSLRVWIANTTVADQHDNITVR